MRHQHLILLSSVALALSGCAQTDPLYQAGHWHPEGVNDANLEVQLANPADLIGGQGTQSSDGQAAEAAITRLREDHLKPLLDDGASTSASSSSTPASPTNGPSGGT